MCAYFGDTWEHAVQRNEHYIVSIERVYLGGWWWEDRYGRMWELVGGHNGF